ncbi:hypothetical protein [Asanoa iriomotensis]|uniref:Uncharacterized protein n=1 Tax=Asanoa iriomotensis TaxID=234613 RepID=A0ABQ4CC47_9ACTN|nr:hypothetical protein [Asanoa iriomotensis]GIF60347.1 hypothetical protein Air01nite_64420 [Asanoa iriomotensis]
MAQSNEDLPPAWLRDYATIEADIQRLEEFATKLDAEVRDNLAPHVAPIFDDILAELPPAYTDFPELLLFLESHTATAQDTAYTVYYYQDVTGGFAVAAGEVSRNYRGSDAFAAARVTDVEAALDKTAAGATDA